MDFSGFFDTLGQGLQTYNQYQTAKSAGDINNQVQGALGQNSSALAQQIAALQQQLQSGQGQTQQAYDQAKALYDQQNQGLQGNIASMTQQLQGLQDPNSAMMQMARQAMERKDAAAGRRSQWGDRETQLAALLAENYSKYAPSIQSAITGAQNQIVGNQGNLAQIYAAMTNAGTQQQAALNQLLQQQQAGAQAANTTGRQAAYSNSNNNSAMLGSALGLAKNLFGSMNNGLGGGDNNYDWGSGFGNLDTNQAYDLWGDSGTLWDYNDVVGSFNGDPYSSY